VTTNIVTGGLGGVGGPPYTSFGSSAFLFDQELDNEMQSEFLRLRFMRFSH
jgi:hypothetical protein